MPRLLQSQQVLQSSPFHSITEVTVKLNPDPENGGDVYLPESWKPDALALAKPGFMQLLGAAGMEEIPDQCVSTMPEDRVYYAKSVIKWTQPDGKDVVLTGDKTMDFRIGGTRWEMAYQKALDDALMGWANANNMPKGTKQTAYGAKRETNGDYASRILATLGSNEEHSGALELMTLLAKQKANREIRQKAQFGHELAQTGAMERAVKAHLGLKSTYTKKEIAEGFILYRSEFRWDMIAAQLGQEQALRLKEAYIMKAMGLSSGDLMQIGSGPAPSAPESTAQDLFADEEYIEGEVLNQEAELFTTPLQDETAARIRNKMIRFHGWQDFNITKASERTTWLFNCVFADLVEGHALLLITFYDKIQAQKDQNVRSSEITNQAKHLKEQIDQCVIQKRLWREPSETADQLPLDENGDDNDDESPDQTPTDE